MRGSGRLSGNSDLDLHAGRDADGGDLDITTCITPSHLLHNLRGRAQIDEALVDAHLEAVPCLGTLTARGLAGGDAKELLGKRMSSTNMPWWEGARGP